jgi:hypothetical protein
MPGSDSAHREPAESKSVFARFAVPFMFNPNLGPVGALVAVAGALARIFGSCILLALWGGFSAWAWTCIANRFWRMAAVGPLVLLFPGVLAGLLLGIGAIESKFKARHG